MNQLPLGVCVLGEAGQNAARTTSYPHYVFEILAHKCEYVDEMHTLVARHMQCRSQGIGMIERALRNAMRKGQLPAHLHVRRAAIGLHAYVDGLIYNWLLDPRSFALDREAEALIDQFVQGLKAAAAPKARVAVSRAAAA